MSFEPRDYLRHILDEADYLLRKIAGMRDRLIHGYFGVDYDLVRDVVQSRIPVLRQQVASRLELPGR